VNKKRIVGIIILIVGIIFIVYANYQKGRIAEAEGNVETGKSFFSGSSVGGQVSDAVGGVVGDKISSYKAPVMILMIGGIVLVVVGGGMALFCKGKRKR